MQNEEECMVEIILDDVVERLFANVISITAENIHFEWGFKDKGELKDLLYRLCKIHIVLHDAQKRQVSDNSVRNWLTELRDVLYDADNVLDKFSYEIFRQKIQIQDQMMNQVPFDEVKTIKQKLDKCVNEVEGLCLKIVNSNPKISLHYIDSSLNDSAVKGREYGGASIWDVLGDDALFLILKSRFDSLTISSLKRCFAYCAIFPKDCDIKKDELIQNWMAQGFLEPAEEGMVMEDVGNKYFKILLDKFILQDAKKDEYGNIISCKMHPSAYDFVLSISNSKSSISNNFSRVRSLFVGVDDRTKPAISSEGDGFTKCCRLILKKADFGNMLSGFKGIRVLKIYGYLIEELPESIGELIHLRLLHISDTRIEKLPKSITELYNLQTIRIENCANIKGLPDDLSHLINLRHICFIDSAANAVPKNVGRLTCLQTMPDFSVGQEEGYRIKELGDLKNLRGKIEIYNLGDVKDEEEAKSAKLKEKEIFKLGLYWDDEEDYRDKDEMVLEGLQPHPNLKSLTIEWYGGEKFPSWVNDLSLFHNLIHIKLSWCNKCEEVPTLGHLPCLGVLEIEGMEKVRSIGSEFYSYSDGSYRNTTALFPALRILKLLFFGSLEEWKDAKELTSAGEVLLVFPCLKELIIRGCNKLSDLPDSLHTRVSLQKLAVQNCPKLRSLPGVPSIIRCGLPSSSSSIFSSLQTLELYESLLFEEHIKYFTALKILWIQEIGEMVALPESLGNLSSLQEMYIVDCNKLEYLPTEETMRRLTELKTLMIYGCPRLNPQIDYIPFIQFPSS